jgi:hypothetical protein
MNIEGANIYEDGVKLGHDCEDKIRQIVSTLKTLSPSPDVSLRLVKSGRTYEGLLWGKADSVPLGAYNRGASINQVLDKLYGRVKRECVKVWKLNGAKEKAKFQTYGHETMAIAG